MFRRKKSTAEVAQKGASAISISGPMRIGAQAPHHPSPASAAAPLYERFAKSTNTSITANIASPARRTVQNAQPHLADERGISARGPDSRQDSGMRVHMELSGGLSTRNEGRVVEDVKTLSREDPSRVVLPQAHQQLSPPASLDFPTSPPGNGGGPGGAWTGGAWTGGCVDGARWGRMGGCRPPPGQGPSASGSYRSP